MRDGGGLSSSRPTSRGPTNVFGEATCSASDRPRHAMTVIAPMATTASSATAPACRLVSAACRSARCAITTVRSTPAAHTPTTGQSELLIKRRLVSPAASLEIAYTLLKHQSAVITPNATRSTQRPRLPMGRARMTETSRATDPIAVIDVSAAVRETDGRHSKSTSSRPSWLSTPTTTPAAQSDPLANAEAITNRCGLACLTRAASSR